MVENRHRYRWHSFVTAILGLAIALPTSMAVAQEAPVMISVPGGARPMNAEQAKAMMEAQKAAAQAGAKPGEPPKEEKKEGEKKEGEGDAKKDDKPAETIKRPEKPPRPADPSEFKVSVDEHGRVPPFNFIGQPWPDVLQWLATNLKSSLDWQELPNDYVNLTTQRSYTLDEVRDDVNRLLNARGFTAIHSGELLSVFKIEKLDPSVVRRVDEEDLYDLKPYDFVKISFELPAGMEVEKAKEDIKQVLSPNAKVFPLVTTKRLLVMDSVANLRMVSALLNEERAVQDGRVVPNEIPLRHARAEKVIDILYVVLGLDPQSRPTQMELQLQQQKLQLMTQMQQQGKDVLSMLKKDGPPVYLAYNKQRNSIIANAPPEQMKIIEQTIRYLDVPFGEEGMGPSSPVANENRVLKKFPLTTLDPETFIMTLEEIGGLSPAAEFKVDKKSKTLFAFATVSDLEKIEGLVGQFDGSGREFHVIPLRRHPADAVAATIHSLMAGQAEEKEESRPRYYWDYYGQDNQDEEQPVKGFGVDADIENNRLLLWANEAEMVRVKGLLAKLGESPEGRQDSRPVRFIQPGGDVSTAQLLERIKDVWSAGGNNELIIKLPEPKPVTAEETKGNEKQGEDASGKENEEKSDKATEPAKDRTAAQTSGRIEARFVQLESPAADFPAQPTGDVAAESTSVGPSADAIPAESPAVVTAANNSAPVTVTVTEDGRIMLSSPDTAALDRMEELIGELSPPERRFKVYALKHIPAVHMYLDLKDFFADDLKEEPSGYTRDWYGFMMPQGEKDKSIGMAKRRKLMITYDEPSNSILVSNASASQIAEIEQLIAVFDKPAPSDSVEIRETAPVKIRYSKASVIATAVKEVYRDLLSSRDKEFDRGGDQRQQRASQERVTVINYGGSSSSGTDNKRSGIKAGFEGALSIGADDVSNVIIVSAQKGIFEDVVRMIEELDQQAAPDIVVRVHRVNGSVSAEALQDTLEDAISRPWLGGRPEQEAGRGRGDRGRRGGDGDRNRDRGRGNRGGGDGNRDND